MEPIDLMEPPGNSVVGIADLFHARADLGNSDEQYRLLFESNPLPMWVFDRDTLRFIAVNEAAIRQYGFTRQEFLAKTITEIRPEEEVSGLLQDVAKQRRGLGRAAHGGTARRTAP